MVKPFHLWYVAPNTSTGYGIFEKGLQAGQAVIADIFHPHVPQALHDLDAWCGFIRGRAASWPTRGGLRLGGEQAVRLWENGAGDLLGALILVGAELPAELQPALQAWRRQGIMLCWEYALGAPCPVDRNLLDAVVVRGYESGGISGNASVRTFFSLARAQFDGTPIYVQGAESPALAAVFILLGAGGVILDASPLCLQDRPAERNSAAFAAGVFQRRPCSPRWVDVRYVAPASGKEDGIPLGPGTLVAHPAQPGDPARTACAFRQEVNGVIDQLLSAGSGDLDLLRADPFLVQGPMALISNSMKFAGAMARGGFFPFLALTSLDSGQLEKLGRQAGRSRLAGKYGIGIAGEVPFSPEDIARAFASHPPAALTLSADQWARHNEWSRALALDTWLHVQHPAMIEAAVREGYRHFILEGCESGGHVGQLPSSVLWTMALRAAGDLKPEPENLHFVLAGGIHDARTVLFGLLLAKAFAFPGKLSFQMGTPLLFANEAAASGALHLSYQERLCRSRQTQVIGGATGAGLRIVAGEPGKDGAISELSDPAAISREVVKRAHEAYGRTVRGAECSLCLAGESVAQFDHPFALKQLAAELNRYGAQWAKARAQQIRVDALDFRIGGRPSQVDIAVVGLGGIFPGAGNTGKFWENIVANTRHIQEVPPEYWGPGTYRRTWERGKQPEAATYAWHAGFVQDFKFDHFDCLKFHIAPKAAAVTDRIHLMLLKAAEEAKHSAGPNFRFPAEHTVVLVGNSMGGEQSKLGVLRAHAPDILCELGKIPEFRAIVLARRDAILRKLAKAMQRRAPEATEDTLVGSIASTLAGRIAAYLNVFGGNFSVDAACASSLAALAVAREMLSSGRCTCAVVGGVDADLTVDTFINFCSLKALAHGISRPFMEGSDGFTMGEGAGVIILKNFDQALKDGDLIYARIVGIGMSSDGQSGSLTMPTRDGQLRALRRACAESGFAPPSVGYVEAHGTGTPVGDAVELEVLRAVFAEARPGSIVLGSVKPNIGHLKSAAGIASLIKTVLALHHQTLPPAWIEGTIRKEFGERGFPFALLPEARPWRKTGYIPRRAAVSSFGFGGSNFHIHLEEMDARYRMRAGSRLLLFAADSRAQLQGKVEAFAASVTATGWMDVCNPEQMKHLGGTAPCRLGMVWRPETPWPEALSAMRTSAAGAPAEGARFGMECRREKIAFLFPGQGSIIGLPFKQLKDTVPAFASAVASLGAVLGLDVAATLWPPQAKAPHGGRRPDHTAQQAATTALSLALAQMLRALGIVPDAVAGHSLGFYATLAAAGVLSEQDALRLVHRRADCFASMGKGDAGCMLALSTGGDVAETLRRRCPAPFYVANLNSPCQTVISLARKNRRQVESFLAKENIECKHVPVGSGFHSPLVAPAAAVFSVHLRDFAFRDPCRPLYSETTAARIEPGAPAQGYPARLAGHVTQPVRFAETIRAMRSDGYRTFLEVGGRGTLSKFVREILESSEARCYPLDTTQADVVHHWHNLLAALYVEQGMPLDYGAYVDLFAEHLHPVRISRNLSQASIPGEPSSAGSAAEAGAAERGGKDSPPVQNDIYPAVRAIISRHTGFAEDMISPDQQLQGVLGIDSLKMVEIGIEIEQRLRVNLMGTPIPQHLTVMGLSELIERQANRTPAAETPARRYVIEQRAVLPGEQRPRGADNVGLLTHDRKLALLWRRSGYGPAQVIKSSAGAALLKAVAGLNAPALDGVVYAAAVPPDSRLPVEQRLALCMLPAYVIGNHILPKVVRTQRRRPFGCVTAACLDNTGVEDGLAAFSKSLQLDFPDARCGHVSFAVPALDSDALAQLYQEATDRANQFAFVRRAGPERSVAHLAAAEMADGRGSFLSAGDVVLATGGGRGITAHMIAALSAKAAPAWILVGSTNIHSDCAPAKEIKRTIRQLKERGCAVEYLQCDLANPAATRKMAKALLRRKPGITGVIHGAGVTSDSGIARKSARDFMRVITVKAGAALILEEELDLSGIRFWINFSSIVAFFGNAGQTDYAAANQMLASQAERLRRKGVALSKAILWSPWCDIGMASGEQLQRRFKACGLAVIKPDDGVNFLLREMNKAQDAVAAYYGDPFALAGAQAVSKDAIWVEQRVAGAGVSLVSRQFKVEEAFLMDHRIEGVPVLPGVMAFELSFAAVAGASPALTWRDLSFERLVGVPEKGVAIALTWEALGPRAAAFQCSVPGNPACEFAKGRLEWKAADKIAVALPERGAPQRSYARDELYGGKGLLFSGPLFQVLGKGVQAGDAWCGASITTAAPALNAEAVFPFRTPATAIDGLFQMAAVYCQHRQWGAFLPAGIEALWWSGRCLDGGSADAIVVCLENSAKDQVSFNAQICSAGQPVVVVQRLRMARVRAAAPDAGVKTPKT